MVEPPRGTPTPEEAEPSGDRTTHYGDADTILARRARLLVLCGVIAFFASTVMNMGLGLWESSIVTGVLFVATAVMWIGYARFTRWISPRAVAHGTLGACVLAIALIAFNEGTTRTPNLHFLTLIVVASAMLLGVVASRVWTAVSIVAAALTFGLDVWLRAADLSRAASHWAWLALVLVVLHLLASAAWRVADASMAESARAAERARKAAMDLEAANAALAAAMQARSQFLANMSHEIRTPLNAVIGFTDLMAGTSLDADQRQYIETIRGAGQGLLVIIDDVLDLARIEAGKLSLAREPIDLNEMIATSLEMLAVAAHKKGIEIWSETLVEPAPTHVEGDAARVRQVLLNLVGNAVKFTSAGQVVVSLGWTADRKGARIEVRDTGAGIAESARGNLFQPFGQEDGSTRRRHGGTGLGLVISKKLIEGMRGAIGFDSEVGKGSCFWIEIPAAERRAVVEDALRDVTVAVVEGRPAHTSAVIAAIEKYLDSPPIRLATGTSASDIRRALAPSGAASAGASAIVLFDWDPTDEAPTQTVLELCEAGDWLRGVVLLAPFVDQSAGRDRRFSRRVSVMNKPFRVPRLLKRMAELEMADRPPSMRPPPQSNFAHRILLVEDNAVNQMIARLMLEGAGCTVAVAGDGDAAVVLAQRSEHDLILMDLHMPDMDGFDATRAIRDAERTAGRAPVPIVALSASVLPEDQRRCTEAGMNGHLPKPITQKALHDLLRTIPAKSG